jgi:hypothetical protein
VSPSMRPLSAAETEGSAGAAVAAAGCFAGVDESVLVAEFAGLHAMENSATIAAALKLTWVFGIR